MLLVTVLILLSESCPYSKMYTKNKYNSKYRLYVSLLTNQFTKNKNTRYLTTLKRFIIFCLVSNQLVMGLHMGGFVMMVISTKNWEFLP